MLLLIPCVNSSSRLCQASVSVLFPLHRHPTLVYFSINPSPPRHHKHPAAGLRGVAAATSTAASEAAAQRSLQQFSYSTPQQHYHPPPAGPGRRELIHSAGLASRCIYPPQQHVRACLCLLLAHFSTTPPSSFDRMTRTSMATDQRVAAAAAPMVGLNTNKHQWEHGWCRPLSVVAGTPLPGPPVYEAAALTSIVDTRRRS